MSLIGENNFPFVGGCQWRERLGQGWDPVSTSLSVLGPHWLGPVQPLHAATVSECSGVRHPAVFKRFPWHHPSPVALTLFCPLFHVAGFIRIC